MDGSCIYMDPSNFKLYCYCGLKIDYFLILIWLDWSHFLGCYSKFQSLSMESVRFSCNKVPDAPKNRKEKKTKAEPKNQP